MLSEVKDLFIIPIILLVFVISRWPDLVPLNFSAAYGLVMCCGAFHKRLRPVYVFSVIILTDILLNTFYYKVAPVSPYMMINYAGFLTIYFLGKRFFSGKSVVHLMGGGILGALLFFLITNTAAWLQNPYYTKTLMGWIQALTTGEPGWPPPWTFLRNTLLSGGLFAGIVAFVLQHSQASDPVVEEEDVEESEAEAERDTEEEAARA